MSSYNMPPDTSAKEKIVGGILDFNQLLFLLGGVAIGLGLGFLFKPAFGTVGLAFFIIIFALAGLAIGFIKIKGLSVVQYIKCKNAHKKKTKKLPNVRLCALTQEEKNNIRNF